MRLVRVVALRIRALVRASALDADVREELRQHVERQTETYIADGLPPAEARRLAAIEVGNLSALEEQCRDVRGVSWWNGVRGDLRYALRQLRRQHGHSAVAVATVALGIAVALTVFAVVDAVLLRPLPYPEANRLFSLYEINHGTHIGRTRAAALNALDWRAAATSFDGIAAHAGTGFTLTGGGEPELVIGQLVTPNLLDVLQVRPAWGRTFLPHETEAGQQHVVILTDRLWRRRFGGDPAAIGRTTVMNGRRYQIVGILPASFHYPSDRYQLLAPLVTEGIDPDGPPINRDSRYLSVVGRLAPGVSADTARDELAAIGRDLSQRYPESNRDVSIGMTALATDVVGEARTSLLLAMAAVGIVLLVAGVNVAGLAIARGMTRSRELAMRAALGASQARLVRQLATEGFVLFAAGGAAGTAIAAAVIPTLRSHLPASTPRLSEIAVDWRLLAAAFAVTLVIGVGFSLLPALTLARRRSERDLSLLGSSGGGGRATPRTRSVLIVCQMAAATVLLASAALAWRSLDQVNRVDTGFDPRGALTFDVVLRADRYPAAGDMRRFTGRAWQALGALPGVVAAGTTTALPLSDQNVENRYTIEGVPETPGTEPPVAALRGVSGRYLEAVGARLLRGRDLLPSDTAEARPVVLVTADFVDRYVPAADPLGVRVKLGGPDSDDPWRTIVGVIASIRHAAPDRAPRPEVWLPLAQLPDDFLTTWARGTYVAARTAGEPEALIPDVRTTMRGLDEQLPLLDVGTLAGLKRRATASRRLETSLLAAFGAITVSLAAVGLFGVLTFYVAQHTREFGVRLALGATRPAVVGLVLRRTARLLAMGLAIGLPGGLIVGRGMSHLLYGVAPNDPRALAATVVVLAVTAAAACAIPARRAIRIDPLVALRDD